MSSPLDVHREQIATIDKQIVFWLAQRCEITDQIGMYKAHNNITVRDEAREAAVLENVEQYSKFIGGKDESFSKFTPMLFEAIMAYSRSRQSKFIKVTFKV